MTLAVEPPNEMLAGYCSVGACESAVLSSEVRPGVRPLIFARTLAEWCKLSECPDYENFSGWVKTWFDLLVLVLVPVEGVSPRLATLYTGCLRADAHAPRKFPSKTGVLHMVIPSAVETLGGWDQ